jgi:hypothetical protein
MTTPRARRWRSPSRSSNRAIARRPPPTDLAEAGSKTVKAANTGGLVAAVKGTIGTVLVGGGAADKAGLLESAQSGIDKANAGQGHLGFVLRSRAPAVRRAGADHRRRGADRGRASPPGFYSSRSRRGGSPITIAACTPGRSGEGENMLHSLFWTLAGLVGAGGGLFVAAMFVPTVAVVLKSVLDFARSPLGQLLGGARRSGCCCFPRAGFPATCTARARCAPPGAPTPPRARPPRPSARPTCARK